MSRLRRHSGTLTALAVLCASLIVSSLVVLWRADAVAAERSASIASAEQYFLGVVDDLEQEVRESGDLVVFAMRAVDAAVGSAPDDAALESSTVRFGVADFAGYVGAVAFDDGKVSARSGEVSEVLADSVAVVIDDRVTDLGDSSVRALSVVDAEGRDHLAIVSATEQGWRLAFVFEPDAFMLGESGVGDPIVSSLSLAATSTPEWIDPNPAGAGSAEDQGGGGSSTTVVSETEGLRSQASLLLGSAEQARFGATRHLSLFGRSWRLAVTSGDGFFRIPNSREVPAVAALGAILSLGLFLFTRRMIVGRDTVRRELVTQNARFASGFEGSPIGVLEVTPDLVVTAANAAALHLFGEVAEDQVVGSNILERFKVSSAEDAATLLANPRCDDTSAPDLGLADFDDEDRWVQLTSSAISDDDGLVGILVQLVDVTEQRAARTELTRRALHDELTQLPNRTLLTDRLERALVRSRRTGGMTALLFIDIDLFKEINDTLGHAVGDMVLVELADRMASVLRSNDTIARFGGDEFVVLCEDVSSREMAAEIAERVRRIVAVPIPFDDKELNVSASIGLAIAESGDDAEAVMRDADIAMYQAKGAGRGQVVPFEQRMRDELLARLERERHLRLALELGQFEVYYQPIVNVRPLEIIGFEALVRWNHPDYGILQPGDFIALADRLGMIGQIDRFVLGTASAQVGHWSRSIGRPIRLAVNATAGTIDEAGYVEAVADAVAIHGLERGQLTVEMTEQQFVGVEKAERTVPRLRELGVKIAIDDFGTGHSSFAQVAAVAFDVLKIDRSLVEASDTDKGAKIVRSLVQLARSLGVETVAEGVADRSTLERIRRFGPDAVQGYLFGKPASSADTSALIGRMQRSGRTGGERSGVS